MSTTIGSSNHKAAYKPQVASSSNAQISPQQRLNNLYQQIDTAGKGHITKAQFEQAFNKLSLPASVRDLGQEAILSKLDPNGSGIITKPEFMQRMEPLMNQKAAPPAKAASSTSEAELLSATPTQVNSSEMSPLDGFALGHIIDVTA